MSRILRRPARPMRSRRASRAPHDAHIEFRDRDEDDEDEAARDPMRQYVKKGGVMRIRRVKKTAFAPLSYVEELVEKARMLTGAYIRPAGRLAGLRRRVDRLKLRVARVRRAQGLKPRPARPK